MRATMIIFACALGLGLVAPDSGICQAPRAAAQKVRPRAPQSNTPAEMRPGAVLELGAPGVPEALRQVPGGKIWRQLGVCSLNGPAEVQGFRVRCSSASFLDFQIADCCIPGDHWQLKGKNWDRAPNEAVTTSPGPANQYGVAGRVYNYGGTPNNPKHIDAYVQCTYLDGVDVFGAGSFVLFSSDGTCTVTADAVRSRIDRVP